MDALDGEDDYMSSMATKMWVKFQKYWAAFSDTLAIACIFDPRYKLEFIDFVYNKIYGLESLELFTLHEKINDLYSEYATKIGGTVEFGSSPIGSKAKQAKANNSNSGFGGIDVDCSFFKVILQLSFFLSFKLHYIFSLFTLICNCFLQM